MREEGVLGSRGNPVSHWRQPRNDYIIYNDELFLIQSQLLPSVAAVSPDLSCPLVLALQLRPQQ